MLPLTDGELVDRQPVVGGWIVEVDDARLCAANRAVVRAVLHVHTLDQHPVKLPVADLQRRTFRSDQLAEGVVQSIDGQAGVELSKGVPQPPLQYHLPVIIALGIRPAGADVRPVRSSPPQAL